MRFAILLLACIVVSGCAVAPPPVPAPTDQPRLEAHISARNFVAVVDRVEPVAEAVCSAQTRGRNCDFQIAIDTRPSVPPNAFQTVDESGRPILGFTMALIANARNQDELAFVLGHEAAHHISGHLEQTQQSAVNGAIVLGGLVALGGGPSDAIQSAQRFGATLGQRRFSKVFELEADRLGAVIAERAGYDALRGAAFFNRIPDPGDRFLGTHPPNADRIAAVQSTVEAIR
jgi:Zn-dependent protease with chaperone function